MIMEISSKMVLLFEYKLILYLDCRKDLCVE